MVERILGFKESIKISRGDITGGVLAAIIGLPMGLAFGVQSGLGAQAGLFTAIVLAIVASWVGGTKTLISDPTGPMTVVAATVVSASIAQMGDLSLAWPLIIGTFMLAAIFEMVFGFFNFGKYVKFMPYPVLSGFMAGIGVIIISVQLFPMMGFDSPKGFVQIITNIGEPIQNMNISAVSLTILTIAIIYGLPLLTKKVPAILLALIVGTAISYFLQLDVPVIGLIPTDLPPLRLGALKDLAFSDLQYMITPALMLGGLGVIDTLLTSVVADNITETKHDSRKTVIGQGIGNLIVAMFGALPGAGATMGTVTNIKAGATSKYSGLLKGIFLLMIVVTVSGLVQYIPHAVLAGILITIGIGIIDVKGIKLLRKVPIQDVVVWVIVLLITLFDNLLDAVGIGFVLSAILFIGKMSKHFETTLKSKKVKETKYQNQVGRQTNEHVRIKQLEGPLFFGYTDAFKDECLAMDDAQTIILHFKYVPFIDQSGLMVLEQVIKVWQQRKINVLIADASDQVTDLLRKVNIVEGIIGEHQLFKSLEEALSFIDRKTSKPREENVNLLDGLRRSQYEDQPADVF